MADATVIQYNLKFTLSEDQTFYSVRKADDVEIGYELRIPSEIQGLPVMAIDAEGFAGDTSINIVIIPESVITIGDRAFKDCTSLQGIVIPRTVENYGRKIFENVPKSFRILHSEFETSVLSEDDDRLSFTLSSDGTFYYVKAANYEISGDIEIPAEYNGLPVKVIDDEGFYYCSSLTSITIPDSITTIGDSAFYNCSGLTSITIPDSVTEIGDTVFNWCSGLASITVDPDNTVYKSDGNCLIEISTNELIRGCKTSIIPNYVTEIIDNAFSGCSGLTSITIPDSVTTIGDWAFVICESLTSVTIGNAVKTIGRAAFLECTSLTSINIPDSVRTIRDDAFANCTSLTSVTIGNRVSTFYVSAFKNCSALTSIIVDPDNTVYKSDGNCIIRITTNEVILGCKSSVIPNYVTSIGISAFSNCSSLTSITIPNGVTSIGYNAFSDCTSLKTVILGKGLETLYGNSTSDGTFLNCTALTEVINKSDNLVTPDNEYVFYGCSNLTKVYFTSTTAGYVDGGTWCGRTLERLVPEQEVTQDGLIYELSDDSSYYSVKAENTSITTANILSEISGIPVTSIGNNAFQNCRALTSITIPDSVTSIGLSAFEGCESLTSITIPDSVTTIGLSAFYNCSGLTSITIPDSVTSIEGYAFYDCSALTSVTIGNSVTSIGLYAFYQCSALTSINIPDSVTSIGIYAFCYCSSLKTVILGKGLKTLGGTSILNGSFNSCTALTTVINKSDNLVTPDNAYIFNGCSNLTKVYFTSSTAGYVDGGTWCGRTLVYLEQEVIQDGLIYTLGDGAYYSVKAESTSITTATILSEISGIPVTSIGVGAFSHCRALTSITIPDSITTIGDSAFYNCSGLTSITIPDSVTSIREYAFRGCESLASITIGNGVTTIGGRAFYECDALISVTIGNAVKTIGRAAFWSCRALTSITIPDSVTSIGEYAFRYCSALTSINIPGSDTSIGDYAFANCTSLTSVTIGNGVTSIGSSAFSECTVLTSITIPDSVTSIRNGAFAYCTSLETVVLGKGLETLYGISTSNGSFKGCTALTTVINKSDNLVTPDNAYVFNGCSNLTEIYFTSTTAGYVDGETWCGRTLVRFVPPEVIQDGLIYTPSSDGTYYTVKAENTSITTANILSEISWTPVTSIGNNAFGSCSALTSVNIPDSITSLGGSVFNNCSSLTSINIPDSVTSIGDSAFDGCSALTTIKIGNGVTSIGYRAFLNCKSLTSITIPNSVTTIEVSAFNSCSALTSITIPDSVTSIGMSAFRNCSSLKTVIFGKGLQNLAATSTTTGSFNGCSALTTVINKSNNLVTGAPNNKYVFYGCNNLTKVYYISTTAGYVDGGTWCGKTLEYLNWNGDDSLMLNTEITSTVNLQADAQGKTRMRSKKMKTS